MKRLKLLLLVITIGGTAFYWTGCATQTRAMKSAKLYLKMGIIEKAEEEALFALESEPNNPEPSYWLARKIYLRQNRWEEMEQMLKRSLSISNKYADEIKRLRRIFRLSEVKSDEDFLSAKQTENRQTKRIPPDSRTTLQSAGNLDESLSDLITQIVNSITKGEKTKIAVIEFSDLQGRVNEFGKYLAEELITHLFMTGRFEVIERQLLEKVLSEQKLSLTGLIDAGSAMEIGKLLGVDAIVSGTITDLGIRLKVNARIISTETGSVFAVAGTEIVKDVAVKKLMNRGSLTEEKVIKEAEERSAKKKVSRVENVFFMEDFSDVEEGMIPEEWVGGEKLMVKSDGRQKFLTNFERVNQTFTVYDVKFPMNFKFEWIIAPKGIHQVITIGSVRIIVYPKGPYGASALEFRIGGISKRVKGDFSKRTVKVSLEKRGVLLRLFVDDNEIFLVRDPNFIPPNSFSFEFGTWQFRLYKIIGKDLG